MKQEDIQQHFERRFDAITKSGDEAQMEKLGAMVRRVMHWLIEVEPGLAAVAVHMLDDNQPEGNAPRNYLTEQEARQIVAKMQPQPTWTLASLQKALPTIGQKTEDAEYFNQWALLTTMLMIQSDSGNTLHKLMGLQANDDRTLSAIYRLALDKLKDQDGVFDIRRYFGYK